MAFSQQHGAIATMQGVVSNNATWSDAIIFQDAEGDQTTGYSTDTWALTLRRNECDTAAVLTLSLGSGLTYEEGVSQTVLDILVAPSIINPMWGDYVADLSSLSTGGVRTHWAHGLIRFPNQPVVS
jgi:hypothetical protein